MDKIEKHLVFKVLDQMFTVNVRSVSMVIQMPKIYKIPQAPDYILGVANVEGDIVPLIDAGAKLAMGNITYGELSQVIIMQRQADSADKFQRLGFLVGEVLDVVDVNPLAIQSLPVSSYSFDERMVDGMHKVQDDFCMEINVENFFSDEIRELVNR